MDQKRGGHGRYNTVQVQARRHIYFSRGADRKTADQVSTQVDRGGRRWIVGHFKQQVIQTLIAQGYTGVAAAQVNGQGRYASTGDVTADVGEVMGFYNVGIFGGNKVEVRVSAVQSPTTNRYC